MHQHTSSGAACRCTALKTAAGSSTCEVYKGLRSWGVVAVVWGSVSFYEVLGNVNAKHYILRSAQGSSSFMCM
jgi:hypothetical protein